MVRPSVCHLTLIYFPSMKVLARKERGAGTDRVNTRFFYLIWFQSSLKKFPSFIMFFIFELILDLFFYKFK